MADGLEVSERGVEESLQLIEIESGGTPSGSNRVVGCFFTSAPSRRRRDRSIRRVWLVGSRTRPVGGSGRILTFHGARKGQEKGNVTGEGWDHAAKREESGPI
jgi:hypothetical protein